jgi:hypothetical protein
MSRPLAIRYDQDGTTFLALEEMNDVRIEYPVYQICQVISEEPAVDGNLTINLNSQNGTSIGSFTDTYRPEIVGSHPATTTPTSVIYNFTQIVNAGTTAPTRPVEYSTVVIDAAGNTTTGIRQMSTNNIRTEFFDRVVLKLAAPGLGAYILRPTAPIASGDTWTKIHTITDTLQTGSNETYIWRKTAESAPAEYRPLKIINTSGDMREMSDTDLKNLFDSYVNYVIATGRGKYLLQETAPTTAGQTWVQMGTSLSDNINRLKDISYTGTYSGTYTSAVATAFAGAYRGSYIKAYTGTYTGAYRLTYGSSNTNVYYAGTYTRNRNVTYAGSRIKTYTSGVLTPFGKTDLETYAGQTVTSTIDKVSTVNLWLRTK